MTTCFVVMGFDKKIAFYSAKKPRTLDLDKTYRSIIRPAVLDAGLKCIRADEVLHSSIIDKPMYEHLLQADIVIADLSTANANAIYELGVRHALRPRRTIVMAESQFLFPFDFSHLNILRYNHLGEGIEHEEAIRKQEELKHRLLAISRNDEVDSPVFIFLPHLRPPPPPPLRGHHLPLGGRHLQT
jgi:hypothetical protein